MSRIVVMESRRSADLCSAVRRKCSTMGSVGFMWRIVAVFVTISIDKNEVKHELHVVCGSRGVRRLGDRLFQESRQARRYERRRAQEDGGGIRKRYRRFHTEPQASIYPRHQAG